MTAREVDFRIGLEAYRIKRRETDSGIQEEAFQLVWVNTAYWSDSRIHQAANERAKQ